MARSEGIQCFDFSCLVISHTLEIGLAIAPFCVLAGVNSAQELNILLQVCRMQLPSQGISLPTPLNTVAIAYLLQKTPYVFPIVGGRKVEHLLANVEALSIALTPEQVVFIESVIPFDVGFPNIIIVSYCESVYFFSILTSHRVMEPPTVGFSPQLDILTSALYSRLSVHNKYICLKTPDVCCCKELFTLY
jgi:hypothetical protein